MLLFLLYFAAFAGLATVGALICDRADPAVAGPIQFRQSVGADVRHRGDQSLDGDDLKILADRKEAFNARPGIRVGDYVKFSDGVIRRVSFLTPEGGVQTSRGGSFYLGNGWVSFSGSLFQPVPSGTLKRAGWQSPGSVWFFHHDYASAGNGVDAKLQFRVFLSEQVAPR